jgi:KipI family sensor histidine kinase inhibitor
MTSGNNINSLGMTAKKSRRSFIGERGLILEYEDQIDPVIFGKVREMAAELAEQKISGILNLVPTYRSLLIEYDPMTLPLNRLEGIVDKIEGTFKEKHPSPGRYFELPTYYGPPYDLDTQRIAGHNGLTPAEVVRIFSETTLLVYFTGFIAALPYIGDLPECLHTPRLPNPRLKLPAGVVGIGGQQAVLAPVELPSGFNYIGRCFKKIYDPDVFPPTPFMPGDHVRFISVSQEVAEKQRGEFPEPRG